MPGAALAAGPPIVETKPATSITQTSATLNGTVNPNGQKTACNFEYGTTTAYGKIQSCLGGPPEGEKPIEVSAVVSGLTPNTTYHFRIQANNASGTVVGSDMTFKTLGNPPTVETKAATAVKPTGATLNGSVNPNGSEVTDCKFEYGTTTSYGSSATCTPAPGSGTSPVAVSASVTGLTANTTYHFRISAANAGSTSTGSDLTFATVTPHYYVNGGKLKEGSANTKGFIAWGTVTLTGTEGAILGGHITCHTAAGGTLFNPEGGLPGEGLFQEYAPYACEQALICPSKTSRVEMNPERLPWHNVLTEEVAGTIRQETTGVKVDILCFEGSVLIAELKFVIEGTEKGLRPKFVEGTEALHPGLLEFDTASGELNLEGALRVRGRVEGVLRLLGFNAQELIAMKNP